MALQSLFKKCSSHYLIVAFFDGPVLAHFCPFFYFFAAMWVNFRTFFEQAPAIHPDAVKITGVVCGIRVENIADPLMQQIRYLDKLIDELAKGKSMEKIMRK